MYYSGVYVCFMVEMEVHVLNVSASARVNECVSVGACVSASVSASACLSVTYVCEGVCMCLFL